MMTTACGLDCYDACKIVLEDENGFKIKGDASHPAGNGTLCTLLNKSIHEAPRIQKARVQGKEVSLDEAMQAVHKAFEQKTSLLWRGSGNMGVMQEVSNMFMERIRGTLTEGSLCDGAGHAGIVAGRGINKTLPLEQIEKAEVVVVWGRNVTVTNAHLMPFLEGKKIVVIDPVKTAIAKKADFHLQIRPRTDYHVAVILARFLFMEDSQNTAWLEEFAPDFETFYDFTRGHRIKAILEYIGVELGDMGRMLNYLRHRKVVFLVGAGAQKYETGSSVLHAIDSLAAVLGLFGQEGCGVHYLGDSKLGFDNPFKVACKRVSKVATPFSHFDTVLVQGGNPTESMPNITRVISELDKVKTLIYFGLYENETSQKAHIVIPAKNFFEKEDVRLSYGHQYAQPMHTLKEAEYGISEYAFTRYLFDAFGFEGLESEAYYLEYWLGQCVRLEEDLVTPAYETVPYKEGFGEDGEEPFCFIDEYDDELYFKYTPVVDEEAKTPQQYWLLSPKSHKALNTQFKRNTTVQLHPSAGFNEGDKVALRSAFGVLELVVTLNEDIHPECVVVPNNTVGLNVLTPSKHSYEGKSACYQDVKVDIKCI